MVAQSRSPRPSGKSEIRKSIERFLERHGMSAGKFGLAACNDPNLVKQVRAGRELRSATQLRIFTYMRNVEGPPRRRRKVSTSTLSPDPTPRTPAKPSPAHPAE